MADWKAKLLALNPCPEAYDWAIKHKTLREAWRMCEDGGWMEWLAWTCSGKQDVIDIVRDTWGWGQGEDLDNEELELQDAYIILDYMPDPPRLPEIG